MLFLAEELKYAEYFSKQPSAWRMASNLTIPIGIVQRSFCHGKYIFHLQS